MTDERARVSPTHMWIVWPLIIVAVGGCGAYVSSKRFGRELARARWRYGDRFAETPLERIVEFEPWAVVGIPALVIALAVIAAGLIWLAVAAALYA